MPVEMLPESWSNASWPSARSSSRSLLLSNGQVLADKIRSMGQPVTIFQGEGMNGPVLELYIACGRRHLKWLLPMIIEFDEKIFYVIEPARDMNKILRPTFLPRGGWRSRQKNK